MKRSTFLIAFLFGISTITFAQDPSAIADYESTTQGMLIPRMTQAQRNLISSPATGLLVYQLNADKGFWFYNGSLWVILNDNTVSASIADGDGDTKVQAEENPDEDRIRFDVRGLQAMMIDSNRRIGIGRNNPNELLDTRGNILIRNPAKNGALILSPSNTGYGIHPELVIQSAEGGAGGNAPFHISRNALYRTSDNSYQYIDTLGKASKIEFNNSGDLVFSSAPPDTGAINFTENLHVQNATGHIGIATNTPLARLHIRGGGLLVEDTVGTTPVSGAGTRLMWVPEKAALRAGEVDSTQWDADNIGLFSAVVGGRNGKATATYSFVGGGRLNTASGSASFVGGGLGNTASIASFVGGGVINTASGSASFVGGGRLNTASGSYSFVGGGESNTASGSHSFVGGGDLNLASGGFSFVGGGKSLFAKSYGEAVFGTWNTLYTPLATDSINPADRLFVIANGTGPGDRSNAVTILKNGKVGIGSDDPLARLHVRGGALLVQDTIGTTPISGAGTRLMWVPDKAAFRAGMVDNTQWDADSIGLYSSVLGGINGKATGEYSFVGGGYNNTASNYNAFVGGGYYNTASGPRSFVGGGYFNTASGTESFVAGGWLNTVSGSEAFIGGGGFNTASGSDAFVGGGVTNTASGWSSCVVGGSSNMASGSRSFVGGGLGNNAKSYAETIFGTYNTNYTPNSTTSFDPDDRLFVIGNGTSSGSRSNALTVLKNGNSGLGTDTPHERLETAGNILIRNPNYNAGLILSPSTDTVGADPELVIQSAETATGSDAPFHISRNAMFRTSDDTYQYIDDNGEPATKIEFDNHGDLLISSAPEGTGTISFTDNLWIEISSGYVGLGMNPNYPLHLVSGARCTDAGVWTDASDRRLKKEIKPTSYGLDQVMALQTVEYRMRSNNEKQVGLIAQDVRRVIPELVSGIEGDMEKGETLGLSYGNLTAVLVKAIQEQQAVINKQKDDISGLHAELDDIKVVVTYLKSEIANIRRPGTN